MNESDVQGSGSCMKHSRTGLGKGFGKSTSRPWFKIPNKLKTCTSETSGGFDRFKDGHLLVFKELEGCGMP